MFTLGDRRRLSVCYEAGPSGYELHRLITSMGVACEVVAPSLVPKGASDRVKTDRRDAVRLALSLRAGMLTAVRVPSPAEEAVRDMVRARGDLMDDRKRMQQRLNAFLLRHGRVWGGGSKWTIAHRLWVGRQRFDEAALQEALDAYRGGLEARESELRAAEARLSAWARRDPLTAVLEWRDGTAKVEDLRTGADDDAVLAAVATADKAGIDAPFGWPDAFTAFLAAHQTGDVLVPAGPSGQQWRRDLAWRHTDKTISTETGLVPLSVAADKIGHVAMRCAGLLAKLSAAGTPVERDGSGTVTEV